MLTSRLGILERLISISRHILGLWIINGLLRDVRATEPWRLRGSIFPPRRHKHIVLVVVVHDVLYFVTNNVYALIVSPLLFVAVDILVI